MIPQLQPGPCEQFEAARALREAGWSFFRISRALGITLSQVRVACDTRAAALHDTLGALTRDRHICTSCSRLLLAYDFPHNGSHPSGAGSGGKGGWVDSEGVRRRSECRTCKRQRDNTRNAFRRGDIVPFTHEFGEVPEVIELLRSVPATVPVEPFVEWLERKYQIWAQTHDGGMDAFAPTVGLSSRQMFRYVHREHERIKWSVIDEALTIEGSTGLLGALPGALSERP